MSDLSAPRVALSLEQWRAWLASLYERDDRLERRQTGEEYPEEEQVDAYTLSGHAEALQSAEIDGDLWGTLEDIEGEAQTGEEAWEKICRFYLERGCVLIRVEGLPEREEWLLEETLARRLALPGLRDVAAP